MSLKKQALSGMIWAFSQQFGSQLIYFIISIVLSRVLMLSDFDAVAMFTMVISIASTLIDGGMASSLVRSKDIDDDLSTVFWFNVGTVCALYLIIFLTAPLITSFYKLELLALSRLASDIFIHMPALDALSGTMTEMLYAGNIVVTGSCLPYKTFRGIGLDIQKLHDLMTYYKF